jgi:cell filamentation protein
MPHPWYTDDIERNWRGYLIPGTQVLRNRVGARTPEALQAAENDLVEARVIELREAPGLLGARAHDLGYLQAIHRQLFQDVYDWAGDLRTVGIEKGNESFCPPASISQPMDHVAAEIHRLEQLTQRALHPRVLRSPALRTRHRTRLGKTDQNQLYSACHAARAESNLTGLIAMFTTILNAEPAYEF